MTNDGAPTRMASPAARNYNGRCGSRVSHRSVRKRRNFAQTVGEAACRGDSLAIAIGLLLSAGAARPPCRRSVVSRSRRPVLRRHCLRCHQGDKPKGGLDLATAKGLAAGADGNPVVVPGKPDESRLIEVVSGDKPEMPKNGKPLSRREIGALRDWITAGAKWPLPPWASRTTRSIGGPCGPWYSRRFPPPFQLRPRLGKAQHSMAATPIDAFHGRVSAAIGLGASAEADRRTLIRRLSYDLHRTCHRSPEEIEEFVEQSGRWLTKGSSTGCWPLPVTGSAGLGTGWTSSTTAKHTATTRTKPGQTRGPIAIMSSDAFNARSAVRSFVAEQMAGDVLLLDERAIAEGEGCLCHRSLGFGHGEVTESKSDGRIAHSLDRDDMVTTTVRTRFSA